MGTSRTPIGATMILRDKNSCTWRPNPLAPGEYQILIEETRSWSDADLLPEDGPFIAVCDLNPCRICPIKATYDDLPELVRLMDSKTGMDRIFDPEYDDPFGAGWIISDEFWGDYQSHDPEFWVNDEQRARGYCTCEPGEGCTKCP